MNLQENQINLKFSEDNIIKCKEENIDNVPKLVKIEMRETEDQEYVSNIVKIKQEKIEIKQEKIEISNIKQESVYTNLEDSASFLAESTNNFKVKIEIKEQEEVTDFTSLCIKNEELNIKCENEEKINIANEQDSNCVLKKFKCNICGKSFAERNRRRHLQVHNEDTNCTICKKAFSTVGTLKEHLLIHNGKKNYYCSICRKSFYTKSRLNRHSLVHTNEKVLECSICKMPFCAESHLQRHLMTHTGEKIHKCNFCMKSFTRKSDLKVHFTIHTGEKNHKCSICERSFSRKSGLKEHLLVHGLTLAYINEKTFSSRSNNNIHPTTQFNICENETKIKIANKQDSNCDLRKFKCNICEKSFSERNLKRHSLVHTEDKNCTICKKTFSTTGTLKQHLLTHTGKKNYHCSICTKTFTRKSDLNVHFTIHTGEKNHKCSFCERSFSRKSILKEHLLVHGLKWANINDKTFSSSKYTSTIQSNTCEPQNQSLSGEGMAIIFICPGS